MKDNVYNYYSRRLKRLVHRNILKVDSIDAITQYKQRRANRMRLDADDENGNGGKRTGNGGNTRIPYGIAKREGMDTEGMAPKEVWDMLAGKGYSASEVYSELKKTGKVPQSSGKIETPKSEFVLKGRTERKKILTQMQHSYRSYKSEHSGIEKMIKESDEEIARYAKLKEDYEGFERSELESERKKYDELYNDTHDKVRELYWIGVEHYIKGKSATKQKYESVYKRKMLEMGYPSFAAAAKDYEKLKQQEKYYYEHARELSEVLNLDGNVEEEKNHNKSLHKRLENLEKDDKYIEAMKYETMRAEHHAETKRELGSLEKCQTSEEIGDWLSAEEITSEECLFRSGFHVETARKSVNKLVEIASKYPVLKEKVKTIYVAERGEMGRGVYADANSSEKRIRINPDLCGEELEKRFQNDISTGYHPAGCDASQILIHEFCHQIDFIFDSQRDTYPSKISEGKDIHFSDFVVKQVAKKLKMTISDTQASVSKYATKPARDGTKYREFFAEALSEYFCSESPREVATKVGKLFEEYVAKLK